MAKGEKPASLAEDHLDFLDDLRSSGVTNMYSASIYLESEFGLERKEAGAILIYWMGSFEERGCPKGKGRWRFGKPETKLSISKGRKGNG